MDVNPRGLVTVNVTDMLDTAAPAGKPRPHITELTDLVWIAHPRPLHTPVVTVTEDS
jgi:hypothetical protein